MIEKLIYFIDKAWNFIFSFNNVYIIVLLVLFVLLNRKIVKKLNTYSNKNIRHKSILITTTILTIPILLIILILDRYLSHQPF